ncbi:cytochrome b [Dokdonella sp.]|uniref:cytochrome b n=1 Tax=Dokdonella sp. TaxID=2291710 RepID=UPI003C3C8001
MPLKGTDTRWGGMAKALHWLMAIAIIGNGVLGWIMHEMAPSMDKLNTYAIHKSIGLTVLALLLVRISWKLLDKRPADEPMPRWQRIAAHATHGVLYLLMLLIPLSGWFYNSVRGYPLQWFKWFNLPALAGKNEGLVELAHLAHESLVWVLVGVLAAHVGGALMHHFRERDNTLLRMIPMARLRQSSNGDTK